MSTQRQWIYQVNSIKFSLKNIFQVLFSSHTVQELKLLFPCRDSACALQPQVQAWRSPAADLKVSMVLRNLDIISKSVLKPLHVWFLLKRSFPKGKVNLGRVSSQRLSDHIPFLSRLLPPRSLWSRQPLPLTPPYSLSSSSRCPRAPFPSRDPAAPSPLAGKRLIQMIAGELRGKCQSQRLGSTYSLKNKKDSFS